MNKKDKIVYAALLHDIGKLLQRADRVRFKHGDYGAEQLKQIIDYQNEEFFQAIKYHHTRELKNKDFDNDNISYIICEADNIASASERREIENEEKQVFKWNIPLDSIYNVLFLRKDEDKLQYELNDLKEDNKINMPKSITEVSTGKYLKIENELKNVLSKYRFETDNPNSLIYILKNLTSYIPSSTNVSQFVDISLYEHLKLTAAIASCMYLYTEEKNITDYKDRYFIKAEQNRDKKEYLMVSMELSGIQNFIYTITSTGAAKMLKARSFYLELLMENVIDEILEKVELTKANIIYNGGAHSYLLLPNTDRTKKVLEDAKQTINNWLIEKLGNKLYLSLEYIECCANNFNNTENNYNINELFIELSKKVSKNKLQRYNREQLYKLLEPIQIDSNQRECAVCSTSNKIIYNEELKKDICIVCDYIYELGSKLTQYTNAEGKGAIIIIGEKGKIQLPSLNGKTILAEIIEKQDFIKNNNYKRLYTINKKDFGDLFSNNLTTGLYGIKGTYEEYANKSVGIKKLGVLRADVDNLGATFKVGFTNKIYGENLVTLSRYSMLSNSLSDFFKFNINYICSNENLKNNPYKISDKKEKGNIKIIYSGGDDVFLVGAWDEIIELAMSLDLMIKKYSNNKIKISAGLGIFSFDYPISAIAQIVGDMEAEAKKKEGKNAITIFDINQNHTIYFSELEEGVMTKFKYLEECFDFENNDESKIQISTSMLYRLLQLFRGCTRNEEQPNKVKIAYLLGRMEEKISKDSELLKEKFENVKHFIYDITTDKKEVNELVIALEILIYKNRKDEKGEI